MSVRAKYARARAQIYVITVIFLLILPVFVEKVEGGTSTGTLYAHAETTTIGGTSYYWNKLESADSLGLSLNASAATAGRQLMGRWVYPLSGIISIPASTWTVTYRAQKSASASSVVAHGDLDILIRKVDNTIRATIATNVANSPSLTLTNTWETLTGTYNWAGYTVVDSTDYLEVAYYIEVTTSQNSKTVRLRIDDNTLPLADQTKIANIIFNYPNQAPVASFTFFPSAPLIYETVTFDASSSYDVDGSIVSYKWDFGDGNITTVTNPIITHVYTTAASTVNYTVTLTVTDNEGSTGLTTQIVPVTNPAILHISLPAGTYAEGNPDKWLEECWLLNINDHSGTFTLRINDTSTAIASYDTHLIIALNDAAYNNLVSLSVNAVTVPKTAFKTGEPKPYNLYTWPSGDVYPTWFNDTLVNLGTILSKGFIDATVSVTFSNATGARMHFDAYGYKDPVPPIPELQGKVTHNPLSADSTVLFFPPAAPPLTVSISPSSVVMDLGQSVAFTSTVSGGTPPYIAYQWYLNGNPVSGATSPAWTFTPSSTGLYTVYLVVTDSLGQNAQSNTAQVTVNPTLQVSVSPSLVQMDLGQSKTFTATVSGGTTPYTYKWYLNDVLVLGATGSTWTFTPTSTGSYTVYVNVTDSATIPVTKKSNVASVTVNPALSVSISPAPSVVLDLGQSVTFTSIVSGGTPPYSYQWFLNNNPVSGATSTTWTFTPSTTGVYTVYLNVTDSGDPTAKSNVVTVTVNPALTVSLSPSSVEMDLGQSKTFTATVSGGTAPYSYKWYLNDALVPGATGSTWTFTPASVGSYTVYVNVTDSATTPVTKKSNVASVTVNPPLSVSVSPASFVMDMGQSVTFTSTVSGGTPPYSYQWVLNDNPVPGATGSSWTFTPASTGSHSIYLNVTDSGDPTVKSNVVLVIVNPALSVSIAPTSVTMDLGQSKLFVSTVSGGTPPYTYKWYLNDALVPGATGSTWTFTPTSVGSYTIFLNVTDSATVAVTEKSNIASATVNPALTVSISPSPSVTLDLGQSVMFSSVVSGGTLPYSYQWFLNNNPVSGATGTTWAFTPSSPGAYTVYLNVTDSGDPTAKSNVVSVTVNPTLQVSISPSLVVMNLDMSKTFTATVSGGTAPYSYKWYLNDVLVPGATGSSWTFTPISTGSYTVYVNVTDSATTPVTKKSNVASVTVNPALTVSISPSPSVTLILGQSITFTSTVSGGTTPYSYQWVLNNNPVSGATSTSWTFTPTSTGAYTVYLNVTDSADPTVKSNVVSVTVNPALSVSISPSSASLILGQSQLFTSTVSGGISPYFYQWFLNGAPVSGATSPTWTFTPTSTGTYSVYLDVTDSESPPVTRRSNTATVTVTLRVGGSVHSITNLHSFESWRSALLLTTSLLILLLSLATIKYPRKPAISKRA